MNAFAGALKSALEKTLPGKPAQMKMAPANGELYSLFKHETSPVESSVMILFYQKNGQIFFPLIKRTEGPGHHSGQISLPGGVSEPSDKSLWHTAIRETGEETGTPTEEIEQLGKLSPLYIPVSNFQVHPFVGLYQNIPLFIPQPSEVQRILEVPLTHLMDKNNLFNFTFETNGRQWQAPYFAFEEHKIWGATAMIISELLEIITKHALA